MNNTYTNHQERAQTRERTRVVLSAMEVLARDIAIWKLRLRNAEETIRVAAVVIAHLERAQSELACTEEDSNKTLIQEKLDQLASVGINGLPAVRKALELCALEKSSSERSE